MIAIQASIVLFPWKHRLNQEDEEEGEEEEEEEEEEEKEKEKEKEKGEEEEEEKEKGEEEEEKKSVELMKDQSLSDCLPYFHSFINLTHKLMDKWINP